MGIRGLTSVVKRSRLPREEMLCNCHLVIDGDNLLFFMRRSWCPDFVPGLGFDYAGFACRLERFIEDLQRCQITPVVLMEMYDNVVDDKAMEEHRISLRVRTPDTDLPVLPVLLDTLFVQVLCRHDVAVVRYDGDADQALAATARRLNCRVLTGDSDLILLGVPCVSLSGGDFLHRRPNLPVRSGEQTSSIRATVINPDRLDEVLGISQAMWPLLAALGGNTYLPANICQPFVRSLMIGACQENYVHRMKAILAWLKRQRSPDEALEKVLVNIPAELHDDVKNFVQRHDSWRRYVPLDCVEDVSPVLHRRLLPAAPSTDVAENAAGSSWCPPAIRLLVSGGLVMSTLLSSVRPGQLSWFRPRPSVEHLQLPATAQAAVPLFVMLSQLLGAPPGLRLLCLRHGPVLQLQAAWSLWKAPVLESVLLQRPQRRRQLMLDMLQLRWRTAEQLPEPLLLLAAALVCWRRATGRRTSRRHVLAALLAWLSVAPSHLVQTALGEAAVRAKRRIITPLPAADGFDLRQVHLMYELQYVYLAVTNINLVLELPMENVDQAVNSPRTLKLASLLDGPGEAAATGGATAAEDAASASVELEDRLGRLLRDADLSEALLQVVDIIEAESQHTGTAGPGAAIWRPMDSATRRDMHPDLLVARRLVATLNRTTRSRNGRLRDLRVTTEYGLYTLAALVCLRAMQAPSEVGLCVWACLQLSDLTVPMQKRTATITFKQMLPYIVTSKLKSLTQDTVTVDWGQVARRLARGGRPLLEPVVTDEPLDVTADENPIEKKNNYPGLPRFISQLYRAQLLPHKVVLSCLLLLLDAGDDMSLRWLCQSLRVCAPLMPPDCMVSRAEDVPEFRKPKNTIPPGRRSRVDSRQQTAPPIIRVDQAALTRQYRVCSEGDGQTIGDLLKKVRLLSAEESRPSSVRYLLKNVVALHEKGWPKRGGL